MQVTRDESNDFLSVDINKTALQRFIGEQFLQQAPGDTLVIVAGAFDDPTEVRCSDDSMDVRHLYSTHEEADSRIVLHVLDCELPSIIVSARDTDIIVLLLHHSDKFRHKTVYVTVGTAAVRKYVNIGEIAGTLGPSICNVLPVS